MLSKDVCRRCSRDWLRLWEANGEPLTDTWDRRTNAFWEESKKVSCPIMIEGSRNKVASVEDPTPFWCLKKFEQAVAQGLVNKIEEPVDN